MDMGEKSPHLQACQKKMHHEWKWGTAAGGDHSKSLRSQGLSPVRDFHRAASRMFQKGDGVRPTSGFSAAERNGINARSE